MKKRSVFLAALAAVLILTLSIGSALAYFYTSADTDTEKSIGFGATTDIHEDYNGGVKTITITNKEASKVAVFIRVKVFGPTNGISGSGWKSGSGGYYYYGSPVEPKGSTSPLSVSVDFPEDPSPEDVDDDFNVIVVYEAVPALYDENGDPYGSDYGPAWDQSATPAG